MPVEALVLAGTTEMVTWSLGPCWRSSEKPNAGPDRHPSHVNAVRRHQLRTAMRADLHVGRDGSDRRPRHT